MHKLLILTEAGLGIGFGHYMRCGAIQEYSRSQGACADMILNLKGDSSLEGSYSIMNWLENKQEIFPISKKYESVLIDSYLADASYYQFLSGQFENVVVMDDYSRIKYEADLLINPNIFGTAISYSFPNEKILTGKDYVILRKPFRECSKKYFCKDTIENILITVGGSDVRNLLPGMIDFFSDKKFKLTIVAGSDAYKAKLEKNNFEGNCDIIGYAKAEDMLDLMLRTDLAISACGQTLHELAYIGVPTIGICIDKDQVLNMEKYYELKFLKSKLYWDDSQLYIKISELLQKLVIRTERVHMSKIGIQTISPDGVKNIFNKIFKIS